MGFLQRLWFVGLIPIILLALLQLFSPDTLPALQDAIRPYLYNVQLLSSPPFPRSQTPIIMAAITHSSHYDKIASVAVELANLGYPITFITGRLFQTNVEELHENIEFVPMLGLDDKMTPEDIQTWMSLEGEEAEVFAVTKVMVDAAPDGHETLQREFRALHEKYKKEKPIIFLFDQALPGIFPVILGAPGIRPDSSIAIGLAPLTVESNNSMPFRSGEQPLQGPDARERHFKAWQEYKKTTFVSGIDKAWKLKLGEMGVPEQELPSLFTGFNTLPDHLITMSVPDFEFDFSDVNASIRHFGGLKKVSKPSSKDKTQLPEWWGDIAQAKAKGKKIVAVSQGTAEANLEDIVLPAIEALKNRDDVLVIASTVLIEPKDIPNLVVPSNTRVVQTVPYDLLLPQTDLLVSNGGYGAVLECLQLGIPMVVSGLGQDKARTNSLIQYTGVGVDLRSRQPGVDKIREGVNEVLGNVKYRDAAMKIGKEFEKYNVGKVADELIQEVIKDWAKNKPPVDPLVSN